MQRDLGRTVRQKFKSQLSSELPEFKPHAVHDMPGGCKVYQWRIRQDFCGFIVLLIAPKDNRFTIEVAWSEDGVFPSALTPMLPKDFPVMEVTRDEPVNRRFLFRLSSLWNPRRDLWWHVSSQRRAEDIPVEELLGSDFASPQIEMNEQDVALIDSCVSDAIDQIRRFAVPYLKETAERTESGCSE